MSNGKFPQHLHHEHTPEEIRKRLTSKVSHSYLRDFIYGGIDGTVTTFAVVSGVVGASLESQAILILGFANLFADGFSMAASNYLGTKTEIEEYQLAKDFEYEQIIKNPEGEKEEVRQILKGKGFTGELLEQTTDLFVEDRIKWIDLMLKEEYGFASEIRSPLKAGLSTFMAFLFFGIIPLIPFLFGLKNSFLSASVMTGIAFFLVGSMKSRWTNEKIWKSGGQTFLIGAIASVLAYAVGHFLKTLIL